MVEWHRVPEGEAPLDPLTSLAGLVVKGEDLRATLEEVATATTLTENHFLVLVTSGATITVPKAVNHKSRTYIIMNVGGAVNLVPTAGDSINGEGSIQLDTKYSFVTIVSDGDDKWLIIGGIDVAAEAILKEIRDSLISLDKLLYLTGRMEKYQADENEGAEVEKHKIEKELKELEVDVRG